MNLIIYSLAALAVGFYYLTVIRYGSNIPIADDFDAVLDFLNNFLEVSSIHDKIALIFSQHNEHRIVFTRLIVVAQYYLLNTVNFKVLIMIGNIGLIGILIVIFLSYNKRSLIWFVPVVFILFEPQYFGAIFFAMGTIQNFYVLLFAFLSLYFLTRDGSLNFITAAVFAVMATFTSGNGILCFIAGALVLLIQKRFRFLAVWLSVMSLNIIIYLYGYVPPADHPNMLRTLLTQPGTAVIYFIVLLGTVVYLPFKMDNAEIFSPALFIPIGMGVLLSVVFIYLTIKKYYLKNTAIYSFIVFILLSEVLTAAGRSGFGVANALSTRYAIMSVLLVIFAYIALIETIDGETIHRYFHLVLVAAISFNILAFYINYDKIITLHQSVEQGLIYFQKYNRGLVYPNQEKAGRILIRSINKGYYRL
ncbi:MAG: hypothetical protein HQK99_08735 [Nitrospirae bacterium]|nr:hypothetical protein [Nitrospirota bacterium]